MTKVPESNPHAAHDVELVAAHAGGDAAGEERDRATALLEACDDCARLYADLVAISKAVAELPAPSRPRDFRITEEQAASLRPTGWRSVLSVLGGPRFSFVAPLGTAMATLGIVGLLIAGPGLPFLGTSSSANLAQAPAMDQAMPEAAAGAAAPSPAAEAGSPATGAELAPSPVPAASPDLAAGGGYATEPPGDRVAAPGTGSETDTANAAPGSSAERDAVKTTSVEPQGPGDVLLATGAVALLIGGVLLIGVRLIARRAD
jgi:hypothetical protein